MEPETKRVAVTLELTEAYEVWVMEVPADATDEWIAENAVYSPEADYFYTSDTGFTSATVSNIEAL